jgi:hypothetical protein
MVIILEVRQGRITTRLQLIAGSLPSRARESRNIIAIPRRNGHNTIICLNLRNIIIIRLLRRNTVQFREIVTGSLELGLVWKRKTREQVLPV